MDMELSRNNIKHHLPDLLDNSNGIDSMSTAENSLSISGLVSFFSQEIHLDEVVSPLAFHLQLTTCSAQCLSLAGALESNVSTKS